MVQRGFKALFGYVTHRSIPDRPCAMTNSENGDTLIEVLIALVVIALTATALLGAFATSITASGEQRGLATTDTVLKSYVESAFFQIQNQPYSAAHNTFPIFAGCGVASTSYYTNGIATGLGANGVTLYAPPTGYSASITAVQYWDGTQWQPSCSPGSSTSLDPQQLTATVTAPVGPTASLEFIVSNPHVPAGAPSQLVVPTQPNPTETAGVPFPIGIAIEDSLGHVLNATNTVTLQITPLTGTAGAALTCSGGNSLAATGGIATFNCSINLTGAGYTLTATSSGLTAVPTNSLTVVPGAPSQLAFSPNPPGGGAASAGSPIPSVSVDVLDGLGNVVTNATGSIGMTIGAGSAQPSFDTGSTTSVALSNGVAAFAALQVTTPGSYTFVATPTGIAGLTSPATSASFTVSPGPNSLLLVFTTPPGGGPNGQQWLASAQPVVAIKNGLGVIQTGNTTAITVSISSHPGTAQPLSCTTFGTTVVPTNGVASFAGCSITGTAGTTYQLIATASTGSGIASAVSPPFTISVGSPSELQFKTSPGGGVSKGAALSPQPALYIEDSGGNVTNSTAPVTATLNPNGNSGAALSCTANPVNAVSGTATFSGCSINKKGSGYTITFTSPGLQSITSSSLTIKP